MDWTTGVRFPAGTSPFLFATVSTPAPGLTQPPVQWVLGVPSPRLKRLGREADHLPPSSDEAKNAWSYISTFQIRLHGEVLI
jgi:hypothetical protein